MPKHSYLISKQAIGDLEQIWRYSAQNWSQAQADKYYKLIFRQIKNLTENPELGKSYESLGLPYHGMVVQSHIIFYRVKDNQIIIIRVLHRNMDIGVALEL